MPKKQLNLNQENIDRKCGDINYPPYWDQTRLLHIDNLRWPAYRDDCFGCWAGQYTVDHPPTPVYSKKYKYHFKKNAVIGQDLIGHRHDLQRHQELEEHLVALIESAIHVPIHLARVEVWMWWSPNLLHCWVMLGVWTMLVKPTSNSRSVQNPQRQSKILNRPGSNTVKLTPYNN